MKRGFAAGALLVVAAASGFGPAHAKGLPGARLARTGGEDPSLPVAARNGGVAATGAASDLTLADGTSVVRFLLKGMDPGRFPAGSVCTNTLLAGGVTATNVPLDVERLAKSRPNVDATKIDVLVPGSAIPGDPASIAVSCDVVDASGATVNHSTTWTGTFK
jgi:hypothetical protein